MNKTTTALTGLRSQFVEVAVELGERYGPNSDACLRAEQVAAALQRLEWALARPSRRPVSKAAAGTG